MATGGTAVACAQLVEQAGASVEGFGFALELAYLNPRDVIAETFGQEVFSLIVVD